MSAKKKINFWSVGGSEGGASSLFKIILGQKLRPDSEYGEFQVNVLHRDLPPALVISNSPSVEA